MAATPLIPPDLLAIMVRGVSVIVASRDLALRPSVMRAVGSQVAPDGSSITVFVSRRQSRQLVQDVAATGHVAAVFSEPATHRTVQVKATRAMLRNAEPADAPVLARYLASMEHEIQRVGYAPPMTRAMLAHQLDDLVAISFEPEQAFDQTPGPKAGAPLSGRRHEHDAARRHPPLPGRRHPRGRWPPAPPTACPTSPTSRRCTTSTSGTWRCPSSSSTRPGRTSWPTRAPPCCCCIRRPPPIYRLHIRYLRTETEGPLFEGMKAQLAGIASHTGMQGVFRLLGSDVYEVEQIEAVAGEPLPAPPPRCGMLPAVRRCSERLARCTSLDEALNAVLATLSDFAGVAHAMVLMLDSAHASGSTPSPAAAMPRPAWARKSAWARASSAWPRASGHRCASCT